MIAVSEHLKASDEYGAFVKALSDAEKNPEWAAAREKLVAARNELDEMMASGSADIERKRTLVREVFALFNRYRSFSESNAVDQAETALRRIAAEEKTKKESGAVVCIGNCSRCHQCH